MRIPSPGEDRVSWLLIALWSTPLLVVGWVVPRACTMRVVGAPAEEMAAAPANETAPSSAPEPPPAPPSVSAPPPESPTFAEVTVGKSTLMACQDPPHSELKPSKCGEVQLDALVVPQLEGLSRCPAATGLAGKIALQVDLNFAADAVRLVAGKGSAVTRGGRPDNRAIEPLLRCVREPLREAVTRDGDNHGHSRWILSYPLTIASAGAKATPAPPVQEEKATSGSATVHVDAAIVRDAPSTSADPIGRLARGTRVSTVGTSGSWVHIRFGEGGTQEGWIYHSSIGR